MPFVKEIHRLLQLFLIGFFIIALTAAYWSLFGADSILSRDDNPRLVEAERRILRGTITDRDGTILVESQPTESGIIRRYLTDYAAPVTGYYSFRYGVDGSESAYDTILRGTSRLEVLSNRFTRDVLHQPQIGIDIQLSIDAEIQQLLAEAMQDQIGAAVMLHVPSGEILAMVSSPTFDPNTLDADWDNLVENPNNPFFNRVTQGQYQPGGIMQTPLMAAAILSRQNLDVITDGGNSDFMLNDLTLSCVTEPTASDITLREAYMHACPYPFVLLSLTLDETLIENMLNTFDQVQQVTLPGYDTQASEPTLPLTNLIDETMGQGERTVTPLGMARVAAAMINNGNAPQPYLLQATRAPEDAEWQPVNETRTATPFITQQTAQQLADFMIQNVNSGSAKVAAHEDIVIGGHLATALSGDGQHSWFIGFAPTSGNNGVAIAVIVENTTDTKIAASIGGDALVKAVNELE